MATLEDLLKPIEQPAYLAALLAAHRANGVPVDQWLSSLNLGMSTSEILAFFLSDHRQTQINVASGMFLERASGDALTLLAASTFQLDRQPAQFTRGTVRLVSSAGSPQHIILPGSLTIGVQGEFTNQRLYTNITGGTLPFNGGFVDLDFVAFQPGANYNVPNSTPMDLKTSLVGTSVSNPIYPLTPDWIYQYGTDSEPDESLKARCRTRWSTVGAAASVQALEYWARAVPAGYTASPVTQIRVLGDFRSDNTYTGEYPHVATVVVGQDGGSGSLSPSDLAAVQANFDSPPKYGIGGKVYLKNMEFLDVSLTATIFVYQEIKLATSVIDGLIRESLADFQRQLIPGEAVYPQKIAARMEDANKLAIRNVVLTAPAAVIEPLFYQRARIVIPPGGFTYVLVTK